MATEFSIEGDVRDKVALVQDAMRKFGLNLDRHFAAAFGDVVRYGRSFDGCIVGEPGNSILFIGGRKSTNYVLPEEYAQALQAIGKFFHKV